MKKIFKLLFASLIPMIALCACDFEDPTQEPTIDPTPVPDPAEEQIDTVIVKINPSIDIEETSLFPKSRANGGDLIGVQINRWTNTEGAINGGNPIDQVYASGVFDDLDQLVFKFVKGASYKIILIYYPNAKSIVYNYPDGTYGVPFRYIYGLQKYKLNQPVYYSGLEGGWSGDNGPVLGFVFDNVYQPTEDPYSQSFVLGKTPRYSGYIHEIKIDEQTKINIKLTLCMIGITLEPQNFTEGELTLYHQSVSRIEEKYKPGDDMSLKFQIPFNQFASEGDYFGNMQFQLFYTTPQNEKYLMAIKYLNYKPGVNYVFKFNLTEREDGSIGIQMPSENGMVDEETSFE